MRAGVLLAVAVFTAGCADTTVPPGEIVPSIAPPEVTKITIAVRGTAVASQNSPNGGDVEIEANSAFTS